MQAQEAGNANGADLGVVGIRLDESQLHVTRTELKVAGRVHCRVKQDEKVDNSVFEGLSGLSGTKL
jgi:hypothetical protein